MVNINSLVGGEADSISLKEEPTANTRMLGEVHIHLMLRHKPEPSREHDWDAVSQEIAEVHDGSRI